MTWNPNFNTEWSAGQGNPFGGSFGGGGFGGQGQGGTSTPPPPGAPPAPTSPNAPAAWSAGQPVTGGWGQWYNGFGGAPAEGWQDATSATSGHGLPPGFRTRAEGYPGYTLGGGGQPAPGAPAPTPPAAPAAPQANGPPGTWNNFAYDGLNNPVSPLQQILFR